jgi:light-regulated signal transduction histidine kinase (bacteriophytochrome)
MKTLIKDLLDYSRIGREKEAMVLDGNRLLAEVLEDLGKIIRDSGARISTDRLPSLHAYPTELKLLLQNLITNAIKFRHPDRAPEITIRASEETSHWRFMVGDNGIGIEPKFLERIFIIFQRLHSRTKYEGSGIGLAHCKKIAELHGGLIWAQSQPGQGSQFYFTISKDL